MNKIIIWIDEAGRWPWAWPVVASVFCFSSNFKKELIYIINKLKDSKKLSSKKREEIFSELEKLKKAKKVFFETGIVSNKIIDKINIRLANKLAMEKALKKLFSKINFNCYKEILVDWNDNYEFKNINIKTKFIIKWDDKIDEIKAASIIAKVTRDNLMCKYSFVYSNFSFNLHKWYGTKKHQEELKRFWITSIHRKSFKPVKKILI